jgi:isoleucyl-tRNA synthetase
VLADSPDEDGRLPKRGGPGSAAPGEVLILAKARVEAVLNHPFEVVGELSGADLVGRAYGPLFPGAIDRSGAEAAWTVLGADFVTTEDGTGVVHTAVMYGEDDYRLGVEVGLPQHHTVDEEGSFVAGVPGGLAGMHVKDKETERAIREWLVENDLLYHREMYEHSYPHCWRCSSALLYMARDSWYVRTTAVKDRLLENSDGVDWHPPEIGSGRMGEWLGNNVDWALSRERYWGTPLPIWVCTEDDGHRTVVGSFEELGSLAGGFAEDFDPHRPGIDEIEWGCGADGCSGTMRRVPEVADAWFDSGSMPFAQWHYPFENADEFERHFPADYIAEGVDQTRGWFYSLLAISTILFDRSPYRAVVVNDLILDADGQKMSKSKGNVVDPWQAIGEYGADVIRYYLIAGSNPWLPKRWDPAALKETERKLFSTLRHTYRFFALYAGEEGWSHGDEAGEPTDLDRWILGRLDRLSGSVRESLEAYDLTRAARQIQVFVLDDLSNWYVRRSRDRFWATGDDPDALDTSQAFTTLHECLSTTALVLAPFAPLLSDWLYRALQDGASVHRASFPAPGDRFDANLDQSMQDARELAALGRAAREEAGVRTRQPLAEVQAVLPGGRKLPEAMSALLAEELNVRKVVFLADSGDLLRLSAKANFGVLGPKHGGKTPELARAVGGLPEEALLRLRTGDAVELDVGGVLVEIEPEDVEILEHAQTELAMASSRGYVAALDTEIDADLRSEGLARELVNRVQRLRRETGLEVADRIRLTVSGAEPIENAAREHASYIAGETLAVSVDVGEAAPEGQGAIEIDDLNVVIGVERANG